MRALVRLSRRSRASHAGLCLMVACLAAGCAAYHGRGDDAGRILEHPDAELPEVDAFVARDAGPPDAPPLDAPDVGPPPSSCIDPLPPAPTCEASLCGNGTIDSCARCYPCFPRDPPYPWPDAGSEECCESIEEECDGTELGGVSCESLGYAGGELSCGAQCWLDTKDCDGCASDPRIAGCIVAPVDSTIPYALALATNESSVAIAWITTSSLEGAGERRVHFARLDASLRLISEGGCLPVSDPYFVSLAATPSGWMLAAAGAGGVTVLPLDLEGRLRGEARIVAGGSAPHLAERPGAAPLVTYAVPGGVDAQLLRDDASAEWTARVLAGSPVEAELGGAVFVGDGFLVAQRTSGVLVARLELDGRVTRTSSPGSGDTETPQIAWDGGEARLTWTDFGGTGTVLFARLDREGARIAPPVALGTIPAYFNRSPMVTFGQETAIVMSGYSGGVDLATRLDVMRVDRDGRVIAAPFALTQDPTGARSYRAARLGADVVVAWIGGGNGTPHFGPGPLYPGRISLAIVRP